MESCREPGRRLAVTRECRCDTPRWVPRRGGYHSKYKIEKEDERRARDARN